MWTGFAGMLRPVPANVFGPAPGTWTFRLEIPAAYLVALRDTIVALHVVLTALLPALGIAPAIFHQL